MDLVSLVFTCSLVPLDAPLLSGIMREQSGLAPHHVRAAGEARGRDYGDTANALAVLRRLASAGQGAYVGLMGVPVEAARREGLDAEALLDPCKNLAVASRILTEQIERCQGAEAGDPLACALRGYGALTGLDPESFAEGVFLAAMGSAGGDAAEPPAPDDVFIDVEGAPRQEGVFLDLGFGASTVEQKARLAGALEAKGAGTNTVHR